MFYIFSHISWFKDNISNLLLYRMPLFSAKNLAVSACSLEKELHKSLGSKNI